MALGYAQPKIGSAGYYQSRALPVVKKPPLGSPGNPYTPRSAGVPYTIGGQGGNFGPPQPQQTGGSQGSTSGGEASYFQRPTYDWNNDPGLMATMAMTAKGRTDAEAAKNDALRKNILASGLSVMAEKLFPQDTAFIQSVKDNPFGGAQSIAHDYEGQTGKINVANETMNKDNLFFSSYRTGVQLPEIYRARQSDEYDLTNKTQGSIDTVNAAYANKLAELQAQEIAAQQQAWMNAMQYGMGGGGGFGGGGGGDQYNALGQVVSDMGSGVGRSGEWADLPIIQGYNPQKNSDAVYDMSGATPVPGGYVGPQGQRYDDKGRVV